MEQVEVQLTRKVADGFIIPLGPANLVAVMTDVGMVGCGAFDVSCTGFFQLSCSKGETRNRTDNCRYRRYPERDNQGGKPICFGTRDTDRYDRTAGAGASLISFLEKKEFDGYIENIFFLDQFIQGCPLLQGSPNV